MGSTLGDLKIKLNYAIGTSETNLMTEDKREDAINRAINIVVQQFSIPQYTVSTSLSFVSGVANVPTDCIMPYLLYQTSQPQLTYQGIDFDRFRFNLSQTFTIKWDTASSLEKFYIYPADTVSLTLYYLQRPTALSEDDDTVRFNSFWDEGIVEKAAEQLFISTQNFSMAEVKSVVAKDLLAKAWQMERSRLQGQEDQRIQSVYEKHNFISINNRILN